MINMGTKTSNNWKMAGQFDCRWKTKCSFWAWCCSYWWETWNIIHFCLYQALGIVSNEEDEFRKYLSIVMKKLFKLVLNTIPRPLLIRLLMHRPFWLLYLKGTTFTDPLMESFKSFFCLTDGTQRNNVLSPAHSHLKDTVYYGCT
jgi:hypothetical protein